MRWKAADLEAAVITELETLRIHDECHAQLIRNTLKPAFADVAKAEAERRRVLSKRHSELKGRPDRLLNANLEGVIEQAPFSVKQGELRAELADISRQLEERPTFDPKRGELVLGLFDFMQNPANLWQRSNMEQRRELIGCDSFEPPCQRHKACAGKEKSLRHCCRRAVIPLWSGHLPRLRTSTWGHAKGRSITHALAGDLAPQFLMAQRLLREVA